VSLGPQLLATQLIGISIVRMSSWRGITSLQAEWRSGDYDKDTVEGFLADIKKIMKSILN